MKSFDRTLFASTTSRLAMGVLLAAIGSGTAFAQDATPTADATEQVAADQPADAVADPAATDEDAIVVTGYRQSLQNAVNTKKRAEQVVEFDQCGRHRQIARCLDRRIDCPTAGPDVAARLRTFELNLYSRVRA